MVFITLVSCQKKYHPPTVDDQTFSIDENSVAGTFVGQILASDEDGEITSYKMKSGNTDNAFNLSETDGKITIANEDAIDYETNPVFTLLIEVQNNRNLTSVAKISVNLNNIEIPTNGMVLYMPFDGNVNDLSQSLNNGIDYTLHNYATGKWSQALDFNGTTDYLLLTHSINSQNGLSFSFWLKTRGAIATENNGSIISKYSKTKDTRCFMVYSFGSGTSKYDNRLSGAFYSDGTTSTYFHDMTKSYLEPAELSVYPNILLWTITNPQRLVAGEWTHCVVNVTQASIETWINGKFCTSKTREYSSYFNSNDEPVFIGNNYDIGEGSNNHFNGTLDELRIYNRALSNDEIKTLFKEL
jgi:hypothetical protein